MSLFNIQIDNKKLTSRHKNQTRLMSPMNVIFHNCRIHIIKRLWIQEYNINYNDYSAIMLLLRQAQWNMYRMEIVHPFNAYKRYISRYIKRIWSTLKNYNEKFLTAGLMFNCVFSKSPCSKNSLAMRSATC